ncbi:MAG: hypothetical protein NBV68_11920 [Erythrobacter sp.]|uniref:hypothetical protein n=1 Tax=Erythrobacter sp. TaxID=1042 RepID=UPI0025EB080D|nr:hypothetical protein [Erythrobacter sp.]MCM0000082.1 hypothetical protein [Erythrobacter sp.]
MNEQPDFSAIIISEVLAQSQPSPGWLMAGLVLLAVLVWCAFEFGVFVALGKLIRAIRTRRGGPNNPP